MRARRLPTPNAEMRNVLDISVILRGGKLPRRPAHTLASPAFSKLRRRPGSIFFFSPFLCSSSTPKRLPRGDGQRNGVVEIEFNQCSCRNLYRLASRISSRPVYGNSAGPGASNGASRASRDRANGGSGGCARPSLTTGSLSLSLVGGGSEGIRLTVDHDVGKVKLKLPARSAAGRFRSKQTPEDSGALRRNYHIARHQVRFKRTAKTLVRLAAFRIHGV